MEKLDFNNNSLYYLLMDHAGIAEETMVSDWQVVV